MIFIFVQFLRVCWNWQTGTFEGRVFRRTGSSPVTRTTCTNQCRIESWKDGWAGLRRTTGTRVYVNSVSRVRIPLCPPELISLYFEESTEIQAFLMPVENSFKCIFAVACDCFSVKNHTKSHENHTKFIGGTKLLKNQLPLRELILFKNIH